MTPVILKVGGKDILLCFNMAAYLLPEGRKVAVEGWRNHGGTMLVKHDEPDVVFFTGGGEHGGWEGKGKCPNPPPAAVRFARDGPVGGLCQVFELDGKKLAENFLPAPAAAGEKRARTIETVGGAGWGFSYGCPFAIAGDRILIRSNDLLYCIGEQPAR